MMIAAKSTATVEMTRPIISFKPSIRRINIHPPLAVLFLGSGDWSKGSSSLTELATDDFSSRGHGEVVDKLDSAWKLVRCQTRLDEILNLALQTVGGFEARP